MSIAITVTLPAFLSAPVLATATLVVGGVALAYGVYKLVQKHRNSKGVVTNKESLGDKFKRKAKALFQWTGYKIRHHWLMMAGSMPQWVFFVVGKCGSITMGATIRRAVRDQSLPVMIIGTLIGTLIEQTGSIATDLTTIFHPQAVEYRMEYKARVARIRTVNP